LKSSTAIFERLFAHLVRRRHGRSWQLAETDDPLEAGLEIYRPPARQEAADHDACCRGGEQALTATALIFAVFPGQPGAGLRARRGRRPAR
jgi:chromosome segregation protein